MNRETKIFLLCHAYPVFLACHMQFLDWRPIFAALFNIVPIFFVSLLLQTWIKTSHIRLCQSERRSLFLFIYFFIIVHIYYAACAMIGGTKAGDLWIISHNAYFFYFAIFILSFYIISYSARKKRY